MSESGRGLSLFTDGAKSRRRIETVPALNRTGLLWPLFFFLITVITRIPFTSRLLYHADSVHFALALEKYDITLHQPHPPGYFLYVMLGRLLNLFIEDANAVFVVISVIFSGLAVVAIYFLGREIYDNKIGVLAAAIAITSPNFWFHGEVALSYIVEAFFSTVAAFFCWKIFRGEHKYIWLSAIALGMAGGIRQNTLVFLLPLWLFSVKKVPIAKALLSFGLLGFVCLLWFVPMIIMTGGWDAYRNAFRELWLFHTGRFSVFERGWEAIRSFSSLLFTFTFYGLGSGIFVLGLSAYSLVRNGKLKLLDKDKTLFFSFWLLPPVLFYLLIFIHPSNPGYVLVFLPALFVIAAVSTKHISDELTTQATNFRNLSFPQSVGGNPDKKGTMDARLRTPGMTPFDCRVTMTMGNRLLKMIASAFILCNTAIFLLSGIPVSLREITNHDRDLSEMLDAIKRFDPLRAVVFVRPYSFFSFRHIMYYLPEYKVYQVDVRRAPTGETRKTFWGTGEETFLADEVVIPDNIDTFVVPLISEERASVRGIEDIRTTGLNTFNHLSISSGDIALIRKVYPELNVRLPGAIS